MFSNAPLLRQFTIRLRMIGAIAMVLVLLTAVGATGLWGMFRVQANGRQMADNAVTGMAALNLTTKAAGDLRRFEKDIALNVGNADKLKGYDSQWQDAAKQAESNLQVLRSTYDGESAKLAAQFATQVQAYAAAARPVFAQAQAGSLDSPDAVNKALGDAKKIARDAEGTLAALQKAISVETAQAGNLAEETGRQTLWMFAVVLGIACLIVVPLTLANSISITQPIRHARDAALAIAAGDLTGRINPQGKDEAADLLQALVKMQGALGNLVGEVRNSAGSIHVASTEVASGNTDLSQRTEAAASQLQHTSSAMSELTGAVRQSAEAAEQARTLAGSATSVAHRGGEVVAHVVTTMDEINTSSRKIFDIISVIDGIAFQTNILALNAAVEAARAGEQGKGFAVVAGEVRSLAQRSAEAAREIKTLISTSVEKVESGTRLVQDAGSTMSDIVGSVARVTDIINEISAAAVEQATGIDQIGAAVSQLDQMTQQNAALVEQSAAAAESLREQAARMTGVVGTFRVDAAR